MLDLISRYKHPLLILSCVSSYLPSHVFPCLFWSASMPETQESPSWFIFLPTLCASMSLGPFTTFSCAFSSTLLSKLSASAYLSHVYVQECRLQKKSCLFMLLCSGPGLHIACLDSLWQCGIRISQILISGPMNPSETMPWFFSKMQVWPSDPLALD